MTGEFPAQMASNAEMLPFDDVIMKMVESKETLPRDQNDAIKMQLNFQTCFQIGLHYSCQVIKS